MWVRVCKVVSAKPSKRLLGRQGACRVSADQSAMPPKPVARPKKDFSVSYPKIQAELATMQAKLTASQEEVAALRVELKKDTAARERAAIEETARLHELLELRNRDVDLLRGSMLRMRETFASLSAGLRAADEESSVALGALGLLEARVGGAGGADVALATLRLELARCEWELSDSKVGIGQAEETVALATMRGELRSVETQLAATASLLTATASTTAAWAPPAGRTISPEMKRSAG